MSTKKRLTEEQFAYIKRLLDGRTGTAIFRSVGTISGFSAVTVYKVNRFPTFEEYTKYNLDIAQRERNRYHRDVLSINHTENQPQEETSPSTLPKEEILVANELVSIRKLLEKLVDLWTPTKEQEETKEILSKLIAWKKS